ncbi:MAG: hypothetical protein AB1468_01195 [Candidatus Micrarchaeota archaeon]
MKITKYVLALCALSALSFAQAVAQQAAAPAALAYAMPWLNFVQTVTIILALWMIVYKMYQK